MKLSSSLFSPNFSAGHVERTCDIKDEKLVENFWTNFNESHNCRKDINSRKTLLSRNSPFRRKKPFRQPYRRCYAQTPKSFQ